MMRRLLRSVWVCVLLSAVLAPGIAALAAGDYAFSSPTGWNKISSGTTAKWVDPAGQEYVVFHPTTYNGSLSEFVSAILKKEKKQSPTQRVWDNRSYYVCGRHLARYVIWSASSGGGDKVWEQLLALWGKDGYVVSYIRPAKHAPSAVARTSLVSICGVEESGASAQ